VYLRRKRQEGTERERREKESSKQERKIESGRKERKTKKNKEKQRKTKKNETVEGEGKRRKKYVKDEGDEETEREGQKLFCSACVKTCNFESKGKM